MTSLIVHTCWPPFEQIWYRAEVGTQCRKITPKRSDLISQPFARRDVQFIMGLLDPQIEWNAAENFLYADQSPYIGVDAVIKLVFGRLAADWADFSISAGEILGGGEIVIASGRFRGTFKANGAPIDAQFVQVFQFKGDKVAKCQTYTDTAQFKEAISRSASV